MKKTISSTHKFPAKIGYVTKNSYWVTAFEDEECEYYDLNIKEAAGLPKYIENPRKREYTRFKFIKKLGEGGHGLALKVLDSDNIPIVLKVALDSFLSVRERTVGAFINRWILTGRHSPNFVVSLFELICKGLPPAENDWKKIVKFIQKEWVPRFIKAASHKYYREGPASISYLGLELGTSGDLFAFSLDRVLGNDMIASISFQILFGLAALHEANFVHKDVQDQNIVISEFNPEKKQPPLYRAKYNLDDEGNKPDWAYADPYLTKLDSNQKRSEIGDELHLFYTIKFIDYGGSRRVSNSFPNVVLMRGISGVIETVSPEALFIDRKPLELLLPGQEWKTPKHPMVPYSKATDIWAAGMVISSLALGGVQLFMESQHGNVINWLYPAPDKVVFDMKEIYNDTDNMVSLWMLRYVGATMNNGINLMWNMVEAIGLPTNETWPGIEDSLLFKVILKHKHFLIYGRTGGWVAASPEGPSRGEEAGYRVSGLILALGRKGFFMLFEWMLIWNPKERAEALLLIIYNEYFERIRKAGENRHKNYVEDADNTWEVQEDWWTRQEGKKKINKNKEKV